MNFRTYYIQVFEAVFFWFLCKLFSLWFLSGSLNLNLLTSWWRHQIEYFVLIWCQSVVLQFLKLASFCLLSTPLLYFPFLFIFTWRDCVVDTWILIFNANFLLWYFLPGNISFQFMSLTVFLCSFLLRQVSDFEESHTTKWSKKR